MSSLPALVLVLHDLGIKYEDCRKMGFCTGDDRDFLESRSARDAGSVMRDEAQVALVPEVLSHLREAESELQSIH